VVGVAADADEAHILAPGAGSLEVARVGTRSLVTRALASSPLRLLTPRNHGRAAWVYTSTLGGGLVDGDALRLSIDIGGDAMALLATQAATKVYRSPRGTSVELSATVRAGGVLVVAPDPVVCFAGSSYRQSQRFALDATSGLVLLDWFTSGRRASGERWQFDCYASKVTIWRDGRLALVDALSLTADEGDLQRRMGRIETVCIVVILGPQVEGHAVRIVSHVSAMPVGRRADPLVSASPVPGGCIVRIAAQSVEAVGRAVREYLQWVPALLGDDPWARKW
jgi:urease accessory protein